MTNNFLIVETANSRPFLNVQDNDIVYDYKLAKRDLDHIHLLVSSEPEISP